MPVFSCNLPNIQTDEKATWIERKEKYLMHLKTACEEALFVSTADKVHNLSSMIEAYEEKGDSMWDHFNSPKDKKVWFYEEILKIVEKRLKNEINEMLRQKLTEIKVFQKNKELRAE